MSIVLSSNSITGLAVGGLPSGTVTSDTLAASSVTTDKIGYSGAIVQTVYTWWDGGDYANNGYVAWLNLNITPLYSNSLIYIWVNIPTAYQPGHAGQGRWLRNGSWLSDGHPNSGNRYQGYGGEEGVTSDGGASWHMNVVDAPGSTSNVQYQMQLAHESGSNAGVGRSQNSNNDQGSPGYPGIYRTYVMAQEIRRP